MLVALLILMYHLASEFVVNLRAGIREAWHAKTRAMAQNGLTLDEINSAYVLREQQKIDTTPVELWEIPCLAQLNLGVCG